jgi:glyoxylase-like metal-dependent hydrolase (beta-lactamase superfamily II)
VRAVALHPDVLVATSAIWQTNCTIVRAPINEQDRAGGVSEGAAGRESLVIDSPVLPAELEALPSLLEQSGFPSPSGLLATHGDWDHLLGRLAFPGLALGCSQATVERMQTSSGEAQRELRAFDEEHLIERERPLALGSLQALPVPGSCGIGERELELHPGDGHTGDGMAVWIPWAGALLVGDYLSAVELPVLEEGGAIETYLATLERLRTLVKRAEHVVPGHGAVLKGARALAVLEQDVAYLRALADRGTEVELPMGRRTQTQRKLHARNIAHAAL